MFTKIDHIIGHKIRFSKFKRIEIIQSIFSNGDKLKINNRYSKHLEANSTFVNDLWVPGETDRNIRKHYEPNADENPAYKLCGLELEQLSDVICSINASVLIKKKISNPWS